MSRTGVAETEPLSTAVTRWSANLSTDGFAVLSHQDMRRMPASTTPTAPSTFRRYWDDLELDGALHGGGSYRYRRYGRLRVRIEDGRFTFASLPHAPFRQDATHIPHYGGRDRLFSPIPTGVLLDPVMTGLVATDLSIVTALTPATTWIAGLHMVRVVAKAGAPGQPTPEGRHRDGHDYIGMHLIGRRNCTGGESVIYRDGRPPVRLTLAENLDSLVVVDAVLTHEVTPIKADGGEGVRDTLLIDLNASHRDG